MAAEYELQPRKSINQNALDDILKLHSADKRWCLKSQELVDELNKANDFFPGIPLKLRGSCKDGTAISRWFQKNGEKLLEWDVMYEIGEIYCHCRGYVDTKSLPEDCSKEYVHLKSFALNGDGSCILRTRPPFVGTLNNGKSEGYLSCNSVKSDFMEQLQNYFHNDLIRNKIAKTFNQKFKGTTKPYITDLEEDGVSIKFDVTGKYEDEDGVPHDCAFSCDNIASVFCRIHWPEVYSHWSDKIDTTRLEGTGHGIVTADEVTEIQNGGCHIIPKENAKASFGGDLMWRWSMSNAEGSIICLFSEQQKLAFLMCKVYYYSYLSTIGEEFHPIVPKKNRLSSFFVKNNMLNVFNQVCKPGDRSNDNYIVDVPTLFYTLIFYMYKKLANHERCEHFFLHDIDILRDLNKGLRDTAVGIMKDNIIKPGDVVNYLNTKDFDSVTKISEKMVPPSDISPYISILDSVIRHANEKLHKTQEIFQGQDDQSFVDVISFNDGTVLEKCGDQFHVINADHSRYVELKRKVNSVWREVIKPYQGIEPIQEIIIRVTANPRHGMSQNHASALVRNLLEGSNDEVSMIDVNGVQLFRHSKHDSLENPFFYARVPIKDGKKVNIRTPGGRRGPKVDRRKHTPLFRRFPTEVLHNYSQEDPQCSLM